MTDQALDLETSFIFKKSASLSLPNTYKILKRLSKHFQHKVKVRFDSESALIEFAEGVCRMKASEKSLALVCEANEHDSLKAITDTLDRHIASFCQDESLIISWN